MHLFVPAVFSHGAPGWQATAAADKAGASIDLDLTSTAANIVLGTNALNGAGFANVKIVRRHAGLVRRPPPRVSDVLGRIGGWYLVHTAS